MWQSQTKTSNLSKINLFRNSKILNNMENKKKTFEFEISQKCWETRLTSMPRHIILSSLYEQADLCFGKDKWYAEYFHAKEDDKNIVFSMDAIGKQKYGRKKNNQFIRTI